jgi:hypothetical protein
MADHIKSVKVVIFPVAAYKILHSSIFFWGGLFSPARYCAFNLLLFSKKQRKVF